MSYTVIELDIEVNHESYPAGNTVRYQEAESKFYLDIPFYDTFHTISSTYKNKSDADIVRLFQDKFGRQKITKTYGSENRKYRIWTFRYKETNVYVLVNNFHGVCFEIDAKHNVADNYKREILFYWIKYKLIN